MALQITTIKDLAFFDEEHDDETGDFRHTSFAAFDTGDNAYFGTLNEPKSKITFAQLTSALSPIPDNELFPEWAPHDAKLTKVQDIALPSTYIKHPNLLLYELFREHNVLALIPEAILEEAEAMEIISQHPHPSIIK